MPARLLFFGGRLAPRDHVSLSLVLFRHFPPEFLFRRFSFAVSLSLSEFLVHSFIKLKGQEPSGEPGAEPP